MNASATHERIAIATAAFCIVICIVIVSPPYHGAPWQKIARGGYPTVDVFRKLSAHADAWGYPGKSGMVFASGDPQKIRPMYESLIEVI